MARPRFDGAGGVFPKDARTPGGHEGVTLGFWFGGDLRTCWKGVYEGYSLELLRQEENELWAERRRLADAGTKVQEALGPILMRIALVEDRLREIVGRYS
ncbi:MAG: hypothetical protein OEM24_07860 [Paracoccaceae bacterium]|nr:hypothetical protein [Paracoccaceae bacterium]